MISVIVPTLNRNKKTTACIKSILNNKYKNFELIVIDQSLKTNKELVLLSYKKIKLLYSPNSKSSLYKKTLPKIIYIHQKKEGKSIALNTAIKKARGKIVVFTDNDCIVKKNWLTEINNFFNLHPQIDGVFGKSLPYKSSTPIKKDKICMATFTHKKTLIVTDPHVIHYYILGLGNNMSLKRKLFNEIGYFNERLGPGYKNMGGGEDSEIIYRILKSNKILAFNPKIVIYHNNWVSKNIEDALQRKYSLGYYTFCIYYFLKNDKKLIKNLFFRFHQRFFLVLKNYFYRLLKLDLNFLKNNPNQILSAFKEFFPLFKSVFLAIYIRLKEEK